MKPNEYLEDPGEEYVPALDEMVRAMQRRTPEDIPDGADSEPYSTRHEALDQSIRDRIPLPERRHCYNCQRWVSFGLGVEEGEDPRCTDCGWQVCVCDACGCDYNGARA